MGSSIGELLARGPQFYSDLAERLHESAETLMADVAAWDEFIDEVNAQDDAEVHYTKCKAPSPFCEPERGLDQEVGYGEEN